MLTLLKAVVVFCLVFWLNVLLFSMGARYRQITRTPGSITRPRRLKRRESETRIGKRRDPAFTSRSGGPSAHGRTSQMGLPATLGPATVDPGAGGEGGSHPVLLTQL